MEMMRMLCPLVKEEYGVQTDPNGLLYMRARYYNPYISRFINADPSGFGGGLNFYAFCNDNPINAEDPFGLDGQISVGIGGTFGGTPWVVPPGAFVGAGISFGFTTGGQLFGQLQLSGMVGGGFFAGGGVQGGLANSSSPIPTGLSATTTVHGEVNAGWGPAAGYGGDFESDTVGASFPLPHIDIGGGYGAMIGVGASETWTFATPPLGQYLNPHYAVYTPIIVENAPPILPTVSIPVAGTGNGATDWLGNPIQSSSSGKIQL
jgi:RHS repeat-associated protein